MYGKCKGPPFRSIVKVNENRSGKILSFFSCIEQKLDLLVVRRVAEEMLPCYWTGLSGQNLVNMWDSYNSSYVHNFVFLLGTVRSLYKLGSMVILIFLPKNDKLRVCSSLQNTNMNTLSSTSFSIWKADRTF